MSSSESTSRTCVITGATGFIGSRLAFSLADKGWSVHALVRAGSALKELTPLADRISIHELDGGTDSLIDLVKKIKPDIAFHLASLFLAQHKPSDIPALIQSNVTFGTQLLEALTAAGVHRLVNTGTAWQHFEDADYCPVNLYAATKEAFETILKYYTETTPLKVITLKLFDTYGVGDRRGKLIAILLKAAMTGVPLAMSPGYQSIDLVHVDDVVCAFELAAKLINREGSAGHASYAISSGNPVTIRGLVLQIEALLGKKLPVEFGGRPYRVREVMLPCSTGIALPGWRPLVNLDKGLIDLLREANLNSDFLLVRK